MTSDCFFVKKTDIRDDIVRIQGKEHHHLSRVVRVKAKDTVRLFDEEGTRYRARVESVTRTETRLQILQSRVGAESSLRITLGQALLKPKSFELVLQKGVELGMDTFLPLLASRSLIRIKASEWDRKIIRWNTIALNAAKQCGRTRLVEILKPCPIHQGLEERPEERKIFLSESGGASLREIVRQTPKSAICLVGPEGGWTKEEEQAIVSFGFEAVNLGENILRAETAAIATLAVISQFWIN